jgi:hypothetical protein
MNKKEEIFKNNIPSFPEKSLILKAMQVYGKYCAEQAWAFAGVKTFNEWWSEFQRKEEQK